MSPPLLRCQGLAVRYGARTLVQGLDLELHAGERWALVGPNGAGKSSLLLVLAGARAPDAGSVSLAERPLAEWGVQSLAGLRSLVTDRWVDAFALSVREAVHLARYRLQSGLHSRTHPDPAAESVVLRCLAAMDCATLAERDIRTLSRGERQRVALAAALAQETQLALLDEPLSHQDPRHQVQVLQEFARYAPLAMVAALHDINAAARFATHALLLAGDGSWQAGPAAQVLTPERLSPLFGTDITQVVVASHRVFVSTGGALA